MPAANPLADYNTGYTSGMNSGTTNVTPGGAYGSAGAGLSSGAAMVGGTGNANIAVGSIVAIALVVLLGAHLLGFRGLVDVSVGR